MRILISAYACEPHKGSEQGIGWDWSRELARQGHDVWVLTRANSQQVIERELARTKQYPNLHFVYHDLSPWIQTLKGRLRGTRMYYLLWQHTARRIIERVVKEHSVDIYHHLTFAVDWVPSFPPKNTTCRKVLGPLGGYGTDPEMKRFVQRRYVILDGMKTWMRHIGLTCQRAEFRDYDIVLSRSEWFREEYRRIAPDPRVFCISTHTTEQTREDDQAGSKGDASSAEQRTILTGGRLLYWKGFDVVLQVVARLRADGKHVSVTIVGNGSRQYTKHLRRKTQELGISDVVSLTGSMSQEEFHRIIHKADVFLYPSFYDSADSVMMEVLEIGTPLVMFPSRGARELLGSDYPYVSKSFSIEEISGLAMTANRDCGEFLNARKRILMKHGRERKMWQLVDCYLDRRTVAGAKQETTHRGHTLGSHQ